jgi:hypothetical protein
MWFHSHVMCFLAPVTFPSPGGIVGTEHSLPKMSKLYLSLIVAAVLPATAHAGWKTYNGRTGWRASVPDNLREVPYREWAPEGDPGSPAQIHNTVFWSPDRKVTFTVYTHPRAPGMSLQESFQDNVSRRTKGNDRINYSVIKDNSASIDSTATRGAAFADRARGIDRNEQGDRGTGKASRSYGSGTDPEGLPSRPSAALT